MTLTTSHPNPDTAAPSPSPCFRGRLGGSASDCDLQSPVQEQPLPSPPLRIVKGREPKLWFDGELVDADSLRAPLTTHALHYGSGVFEGIRCYATVDGGAAVFRLPEHLERMRKGAALFGIAFDIAEATQATLAVLRANQHRDAYVRPLT